MSGARFSASGISFGIHEWRGSGPVMLHVHHSDDEAWHVLEGQLMFRMLTAPKRPAREQRFLCRREWPIRTWPQTMRVI